MTEHRSSVRGGALALFAVAVAARLFLHPNTPYKAFLLSAAPVLALWLLIGLFVPAGAKRSRRLAALTVAGAASLGIVAAWSLLRRPDIIAPLSIGWTAPALIGVWLAVLLLLAACTGALNPWFRHGPMTALGVAAILYALASGFAPLPLGAPVMTAAVIWVAVWQAVYLYKIRIS